MVRVYTSSPLALVCMEALSINGYILNGKRFRPAQKLKFAGQAVCPKLVVLRDGDTIEIPHTSLCTSLQSGLRLCAALFSSAS